jgi:hypothetical protein
MVPQSQMPLGDVPSRANLLYLLFFLALTG